jgi:branched-subunit amino acid aminotransferase/4-amino-4-deoxychorismate lyase
VATNSAVAVNVADVESAGTITEAGTGSAVGSFDNNVTVLPPAGAAWVKATVQVVEAPDVKLAGVHASEDTPGLLLLVTVTAPVALAPSVAVTVTVWDVATEPAVAVNVVEFVVAGTVAEAGTGNAVMLFDDSATILPPAGAA